MSLQVLRHVILVGMGEIGKNVLHTLPKEWKITVIDKDINRLQSIPDTLHDKEITKLCDNASSRLVLKESQLHATSILGILTKDDELNKEIVKIAREEFDVESIFVIQNHEDTKFGYTDITVIKATQLIGNRIATQMSGTLSAQGIGLEKGEIRQVTVLNSSAARGQTLRTLNPKTWLVAAIYREGNLIIPHGDTTIQAGDKVVVVGNPETLNTEIQFLQGGQIIFPTQYGRSIARIQGEPTGDIVQLLLDKTQASISSEILFTNVNPKVQSSALIRQYLLQNEIGMLVVHPKPISWFARWGFTISTIMSVMFSAQIPFLASRHNNAFKKILLCVKADETLNVLGTVALDITRQFEAELTVLSVYTPNIDQQQRDSLASLPNKLESLARSHGTTITKKYAEGNPIKEIRKIGTEFDIIIVGYSGHPRSTITNPDISLHLYHDAPTSVLFVPWQTAGR